MLSYSSIVVALGAKSSNKLVKDAVGGCSNSASFLPINRASKDFRLVIIISITATREKNSYLVWGVLLFMG